MKHDENKDMNHRTKSVVRHMVEGDKSRAGYLLSQPLDGVELLLQGQSCISQGIKATEVKRAEEEVELNPKQRVRYEQLVYIFHATAATLFLPVVIQCSEKSLHALQVGFIHRRVINIQNML